MNAHRRPVSRVWRARGVDSVTLNLTVEQEGALDCNPAGPIEFLGMDFYPVAVWED